MTTRLIVIRHGKPISEGYAEDALRPLSDEGRKDLASLAKELKKQGFSPKIILTSPLLRAVQSAETVAEILECPCQEEPALGPQFNREVIFDHLPSPEHEETIALMGHMPTLAELVEDLVGSRVLPDGISKSSAVVLEFPESIGWGKAKLVGTYKP